ncbi:10966_t:CDS:2 [Diversispora eburnea]|uniref:10966_t:CDS:1 n=1 Tax=Diversispora eburnea TaxID=1213867 RepID=A0A9N9ATK0_9GLOM|nr:10966_t:CDS:2 [Diversispora eburnea]
MSQPNLPTMFPSTIMPPLASNPPSHSVIGRVGKVVHKLRTTSDTLGNISDAVLGEWDEYQHALQVLQAILKLLQHGLHKLLHREELFPSPLNNAINDSCAQNGVISQTINNAINDSCAQNGAISQTINNAINDSCVQNGAISQTINNAINNACAQNGAINQTINNVINESCAQNGNIYNLIDVRARTINANATRNTDLLQELPNSRGIYPSTANIHFPRNRSALQNLTRAQINILLNYYNQPTGANIPVFREALRVFIGVPPF